MLTVEELADSLGLSTDQVRRRLEALGDTLAQHRKRGKKSKILVDSGGLEMLRRLEALREESRTIDEAAEKIKSEVTENQSGTDREPSATQRSTERQGELAEELRDRVRSLEEDKKELRKQLAEKDRQLERKEDQIQQLLPSAQENGNGKEDEFKEMGLFQLVKRWLTTKA